MLELLAEDEVNSSNKTRKARKVVPLEWVALDEENGKERKDYQRDNLLDNLQLPECEWAAKLRTTNTVGRYLEAVLKKRDTPADKHDGYNTEALQLRLKCDMSIPRQRHKDVRADEKRDG